MVENDQNQFLHHFLIHFKDQLQKIMLIHWRTTLFNLLHHMIPSILKPDLPPWRVNTLYLVVPIINRGTSPMYSIYQPHTPRLCIRYCIPKCPLFWARGAYLSSSFISFFLTHYLSLFCLYHNYYIRTE
jgi:hypothetical protein